MVIQRWQSLCLLVAVILTVCLNFMPLAYADCAQSLDSCPPLMAGDFPILLILSILTAVLLFIDIFMYKNLMAQMRIAVLCVVLLFGMAIVVGILLYTQEPGVCVAWGGAFPMWLGAVIFTIGSRCLMKKDYKLLHNADRLR